MWAKGLAGVLVLAANLAAGGAVFAGMLLGMNGFSESDANWGIGAYILCALAVTAGMVVGAVLAVRFLAGQGWNEWGAAALAAAVFAGVGAGLKVVCGIIGVLVAEAVRVNF